MFIVLWWNGYNIVNIFFSEIRVNDNIEDVILIVLMNMFILIIVLCIIRVCVMLVMWRNRKMLIDIFIKKLVVVRLMRR